MISTEDVLTHPTAVGLITSGFVPAGDEKSGSGGACVGSEVIDSEGSCLSTMVSKDCLKNRGREEARPYGLR